MYVNEYREKLTFKMILVKRKKNKKKKNGSKLERLELSNKKYKCVFK